MKFTTTLFILLFSYSLGFAQEYIGPKAEIDQILENAKNFSHYIVDADYGMILNAYTADAKIFPDNTEILTGEEAILKYWTLPEGVSTSYHKLMPEEIKIMGDEAYDYGYYEGTTQRSDGSESSWKGKYVVVWRKEKGEWKMYLDIWNGVK